MRQEAEEETHVPTEQKWSHSQMNTAHVRDGITDKWAIIGK